MAINVSKITKEQSDAIFKRHEGHFMDFKSIDIAPKKLTHSISAFANASGGELFIGIEENPVGRLFPMVWRGFKNPEAANGHIQIFEQLFPLGQDFTYTFLQHPTEPGLVLQVEISKTRDIIPASDRIPYLRRSASNLPQDTPEKLARLRLDKGLASFESETCDAPIELVSNSVPLLEFLTTVIPSAEPEPWLIKQQLIKSGKPTVAAILLFAETPQAVLPKRCGIKLYRYKSSALTGNRETLDGNPETIEGHLYEQIKIAVQRTTALVESVQKLGPKGFEAIVYPQETLHEILTNAVLHRDYSIPADIHIRVFDNRIEIESPGKLPGHVTVDNLLTEQFARNGALVRMINKFPDPPNKDVGEGLNTAFNAMSAKRLKPPVPEERETSFVFHIKHEPLASADETVMEYLETHSEIANRIGRQITGIQSENSMKNVFIRLQTRGMIEQIPGRKGFSSAWRKKTSAEKPVIEISAED